MAVDTFNPDAAPESTTVDGYVARQTAGTWSEVRTGAGTGADDSGATFVAGVATDVSDQIQYIRRSAFLFDVSSIDSADLASAATLQLYVSADVATIAVEYVLTAVSLADNTALTTADYAVANWGSTRLSDAITGGAFTTSAYNTFTLNAAGIAAVQAAIEGDGIVALGLRFVGDVDDSEPTHSASKSGIVAGQTADAANAPILSVTHGPAPTITDFLLLGVE